MEFKEHEMEIIAFDEKDTSVVCSHATDPGYVVESVGGNTADK